MMVKGSAPQAALFASLLAEAAEQAEAMRQQPGQAIQLAALSDDGYSAIDRLELSPCVRDQLLAVALRLPDEQKASGSIRSALAAHFERPVSPVAIEAQHRAMRADGDGPEPPVDLAERPFASLARRLPENAAEKAAALAHYAALYADLWCDPRIGAAPSARRIMLAMARLLHARREAVPTSRKGKRR